MQLSTRKSRFVALLTGATILSATLFHPTPASANDSKNWKYGAIGLGVLGAYALSKGKNVEGAAALGGAYYAYKKGEQERKEDQWHDGRNNRDDRWDRRSDRRDNRRDDRRDRRNDYYNGSYNNGGYYNGNYNTYLR